METAFENGHRLSVLIADDEPAARRSLWRLLEIDADIKSLTEAVDGPSAIEAIETINPDIVFLDVQMPGFECPYTGCHTLDKIWFYICICAQGPVFSQTQTKTLFFC